jgi:sugar phosphate isomerase/epimerase
MLGKRRPSPTQETEHGIRNRCCLCLSTSRSPAAEIDRELECAGEAGFSCVELWAPALEAYLTRYPLVWLDMQLRQHGIRTLVINGLSPLPVEQIEDALVSQARFLELCTHLDTLGGGTVVLHPAKKEGSRGHRAPEFEHTLRVYADLAAPFEIILAVEFRVNSIVPDLGTAQALLDRAARSNLRLAFSAREWAAGGGDLEILDAFELGALALVHLDSQTDRQPQAPTGPTQSPAQAEPDLAQDLCARLSTAGFCGPYCIPLSSEPGTPLERARAAQEIARRKLETSP